MKTKRSTAEGGISCDGYRTEPAGGRPTEARFVRELRPWHTVAELPLDRAPGSAAAGPVANGGGPMNAAEGCMSHGAASGGADNSLRRSWLARSRAHKHLPLLRHFTLPAERDTQSE